MGRLKSFAAVSLALVMTGMMGSAALADEVGEKERIEQVIINMPDVYVYGEGFDSVDAADGQAFVSQKKLELDSARSTDGTEDGISYYMLLDISASIPTRYFDEVKVGIQNLQDSLRPQDTLKLCAFGSNVNLAADGSQDSDQMAAILSEIKNKDQETLLFEAIDRMADVAEKERQDKADRIVMMVVTDGEDFATGKTQFTEALNTLGEKGLPAYAFCIKDTKKEYINAFGEFSRTSGGKMRVFEPAEGEDMLVELADELHTYTKLTYTAETNEVTNSKQTFSLKFADESVISKEVMENHWIPDNESPYLTNVEAVNATQIRLTFSEPVQGADNASNYKLLDEEQDYPINNVAYDDATKTAVSLFLNDNVYAGDYSLAYNNITDISMEKNPLLISENSNGLTMGGKVEGTEEGSKTVRFTLKNLEERIKNSSKEAESKKLSPAMGALLILFLALAGTGIGIAVKKSKKNRPEEAEPAPAPAPTPVPAPAPIPVAPVNQVNMAGNDFRQHVAIQKMRLNVWIESRGMQPVQTVWELGSSLICGRDAMCDIRIDDRNMSRQHFSLELDGGRVFVQDLHSTNGTSVNGIRIADRRVLNSGDVLDVGSVRITIRW